VTENVDNANGEYPVHHGDESSELYSADARQFVTFQTKSGKNFYLIINHDEESENVLLLTEVSEADLMHMVEEEEVQEPVKEVVKEEPEQVEIEEEPVQEVEEKSNFGTYLILILVIGGVMAGGYYLKVVKGKEKEELKKVYQELNLEKNNVKEQRKLYEKGSLEYETLNEKYKKLQQKEKEAREEYKNIGDKLETSKIEIKNKDDYKEKIKNEILDIFETHTKLVEPTFGANFYKVENRKDFFNKVLKKIKEPLNAQLNEIEHLKRENANLNTTLENSIPKEDYVKAREDYVKAAKAFEIKNKQNLELVKKNKELNEFIKEKGLDIQDIENNNINNDMDR
jgi:predicted secreted protein